MDYRWIYVNLRLSREEAARNDWINSELPLLEYTNYLDEESHKYANRFRSIGTLWHAMRRNISKMIWQLTPKTERLIILCSSLLELVENHSQIEIPQNLTQNITSIEVIGLNGSPYFDLPKKYEKIKEIFPNLNNIDFDYARYQSNKKDEKPE